MAGAILGSKAILTRINKNEYPLLGGIIGPFEAWLVGRGLRSLPARMRQHQSTYRGGAIPQLNLVRLHVGLEDADDLIEDLVQALQQL